MDLIQGMVHVFNTWYGTLHLIQGMLHVFNTMHDLWIQYFFKAYLMHADAPCTSVWCMAQHMCTTYGGIVHCI